MTVDYTHREVVVYKYVKNALENDDISHPHMDRAIKTKGMFILIPSEKIKSKDVMPLYDNRRAVEQIYDICSYLAGFTAYPLVCGALGIGF